MSDDRKRGATPTTTRVVPEVPTDGETIHATRYDPSLSFTPGCLRVVVITPITEPFVGLVKGLGDMYARSVTTDPAFPMGYPAVATSAIMCGY